MLDKVTDWLTCLFSIFESPQGQGKPQNQEFFFVRIMVDGTFILLFPFYPTVVYEVQIWNFTYYIIRYYENAIQTYR